MSRLFDRLGPINITNGPAFKRTWQKLCQELEERIVDINSALAEMPEILPITVTADYTGTVEDGQLPRNVIATRYQGNDNVTTDSEWSFTVDSGSITASIGAATGVLNITALGSTSAVTISSDYGGVTKTRRLLVTKQIGAAPSSGSGGGTTATDTSFNSINATSHAAISGELTVTVGAGGEVALTAPLTVTTDAGAPAGSYEVYGVWKWWDGGSWVDVDTEVASSPDAEVVNEGGIPPDFTVTDGSISVAMTKTGLVAAASEKFQLYARNASGTRTMYFSGTATAVGQ